VNFDIVLQRFKYKQAVYKGTPNIPMQGGQAADDYRKPTL